MSIAPTTRERGACDGRRCGLGRPFGRFRRDESGSLIIFSLMMLVAMIFVAGLAVDFMRFESTRSRMQNTMDRAVLAAASLKQTQDPEAVVRDYFERAGLGEYIGKIEVTQELAAGTASYRKVKVVAGATMDPIFLPIMEDVVAPRRWYVREGQLQDAITLKQNPVDFRKMPILASSTAEEGISDLEISLVLDVSGSMGWKSSATGNRKIDDLREAAKDFAYNVQCNPNQKRGTPGACEVEHGKVSITLVPYSEQVSAGPHLLNQFNVTKEHESSFCVDFSQEDFATTGMGNYVKDSAVVTPLPEDILQRTGHFDPWRKFDRDKKTIGAAGKWTCRTEEWRHIKPFMDDLDEVYAAIDALSAGGNTSIDVGMKWGAALIDPEARAVVTNLTTEPVAPGATETVIDPIFRDRPYDYERDYNLKAIVLMTDGVNTKQHYLKDDYRDGPSEVWHYRTDDGSAATSIYSVYNDARAKQGKKPYRWVWANGTYADNGYWKSNVYTKEASDVPYQMTYPEVWAKLPVAWFNRFDWLPNAEKAHNNAAKNARLAAICEAAKKKDILVYTIGFEVAEGSEEEAVMRSCATTYNHFFMADGMNISKVFGAIASSINQLRLTE